MQDPKETVTAESRLDTTGEFEAFHSADRIREQNAERQRQIDELQKRRAAAKASAWENAYSIKLRATKLAISKRRAKNKAARQQRKRTR